jgi:hypothetical protein
MSESTRQRSLDKLFGKERPVRRATAGEDASPAGEATAAEAPASPAQRKRASVSPAKRAGTGRTSGALPAEEKAQEGPGGYLGKGRYRRGDGVMEKSSVYLRPDQVQALRVAAATKDDPNGTTMSEIIQSLLDAHGYGAPEHRKA